MTKKEFIFNEVKKAVISGEYKAGSILISENNICPKYNVSREPVRRALKQLKEKGIVLSHDLKNFTSELIDRDHPIQKCLKEFIPITNWYKLALRLKRIQKSA